MWTCVGQNQNVSIPYFQGAKDDEGGGDNWSYKTCKAQMVTTNKPTPSLLTGQIHFLSPKQQCQSAEGKKMQHKTV